MKTIANKTTPNKPINYKATENKTFVNKTAVNKTAVNKTLKNKTIARRTTGIGSLPHHNIDTALEYSFKFGLPFLPQIPIRSPWEFMIAQALEGLPGLLLQELPVNKTNAHLDLETWKAQSHLLDLKLKAAFDHSDDPQAFQPFEPSATALSCWQPFLWELVERNISIAKIQIMGPLTAQWVLTGNHPATPELTTQILQLILARSIAMTRRMISSGIQPVLYFDEPGFYLLNPDEPRHVLALQELKLVVQTLRREGATVGLHCCSNTAWEAILDLGLDILSIDTALSLKSALSGRAREQMQRFLENGGTLSLGIIPTDSPATLAGLDSRGIVEETLAMLLDPLDTTSVQRILQTALFTPACGLGLHSCLDAELILEKLNEVYACFTT